MMKGLALVLGVAVLATSAVAQEGMPPNYTVNVVRENAQGTILVNGVPVHGFGYDPADAGTPVTDSVSVGLWLVDGANTLAVESKALADGGYAEVTVLESFDAPYLLEQRIEGEGRAEVTVTVSGAPRWAFLDAEPVNDGGAGVLGAVKALHEAVARGDVEAFEAAHAAREADFTMVFGPMPEAMRAEMHEFLKLPLHPLAGGLVATPYLEGRVWIVTDGKGEAPIQIFDDAQPDTRLATGEFWIRKDGVWSIVR
jgi:hypothetical protein